MVITSSWVFHPAFLPCAFPNLGYQAVSVANIRISASVTTTQDYRLESSAIEVEALEVIAERPLIQRNTTNTTRLTTQEDWQNLPIHGLQNLLEAWPKTQV